MLSLGSLSAFSFGAEQPRLAMLARPVQRVRAIAEQPPPAPKPMASLASPRIPDAGLPPNRILPRGSLLDLSM